MERGLVFFNMWCFHLRSAQCCQLTHFLSWTATHRLCGKRFFCWKNHFPKKIKLSNSEFGFHIYKKWVLNGKVIYSIVFLFSCSIWWFFKAMYIEGIAKLWKYARNLKEINYIVVITYSKNTQPLDHCTNWR